MLSAALAHHGQSHLVGKDRATRPSVLHPTVAHAAPWLLRHSVNPIQAGIQ
jgi:hypothetical protein